MASKPDDALARRLSRIRSRLRVLAALDGAVIGGATAVVAAAIAVAVCRWRGSRLPLPALVASIGAAALAGALLRAGRRISLDVCARKVDAILDRQDRVLSALWLAASPAPLARAAVADALARTERLAPGAAAPARRPAGLSVLAAGTAVLALACLIPGRSRAARLPAPRPPAAAAAPLPATALESERVAIAAALARAEQTGDPALGRLASALDRIVRGLANGTIDPATALEALRGLDEQAQAAADAAARDAQAAAAAAKALAASAVTRDAADALRRGAGDDQASAALGSSAARAPAATGGALHDAATAMAASASASADEGQPGRRRLKRDEPGAPEGARGETGARPDSEDRKLERLSRDLDDTASRCAQGDPSCRGRAEGSGRELSQLQREGAGSSSLRDLSRATRQLHDRVARGDLRSGDSGAARAFARAAAGGRDNGPSSGSGNPSTAAGGAQPGDQMPAQPAGADGQAGGGLSAQAGELATEAGAASGSAESSAAGAGIGHENGGAPLGARDSAEAPPGRDARVPVADGAGPSRAQVIDGAAGRGFASRPYAHVYTEYRAALEEALGATGVPPGQQYLVRRYFDLIRPRTGREGNRR